MVSSAGALEHGAIAPSLNAGDSEYGAVSLGQPGEVRYVQFWASWCGSCREEMKWIKELQSKIGQKDFKVISVNVDQNPAAAQRLLADLGPIDFKVIFDSAGKLPEKFEVTDMPSAYLIGRNGKIEAVHRGFCPSDEPDREAAIRKALSAKQ
jgi:thiol-disulfide isomerase/thioredoxin